MVLQPQTFRTEVPIQPLSHGPLLRHEDPLLLLGSCFSEGVGGRLQAAGHDALANPLGTLFSPASIRRATELLLESLEIDEHLSIAYYFLGMIRRDRRQYVAAIESFEAAVAFDSQFELAQKALDQTRELSG